MCFKVTFSVIFYAVAIKKLRIIEQLLHEMFFSICRPSKSEYFSLCFLSYVIHDTFVSAIPKTSTFFLPNNTKLLSVRNVFPVFWSEN